MTRIGKLHLNVLPRESSVAGAAPAPVSSAAFSSCDEACDPYVAPDVDLVPALEKSIARVRNEKAVAEYNATCNANAPPMPNPERSTPEHASEASGRARGKW